MSDKSPPDRAQQLSFGEFRGRWLDQVERDPEINHGDFRVAYRLIRYVNRKTRVTFVGYGTLSEVGLVGLNTVRRAIDKLRTRGHVTVMRPAGNRPLVIK